MKTITKIIIAGAAVIAGMFVVDVIRKKLDPTLEEMTVPELETLMWKHAAADEHEKAAVIRDMIKERMMAA